MKEKKSKGVLALYIVVAVVLFLLTLVTVANMTGNTTLWGTLIAPAPSIGNNTKNCTDSDGGLNYFVKGTTKNYRVNFTDYCVINNQLKEGYCDKIGEVRVNMTGCSLYGMICVNGACKYNQSNQSNLTESAGASFGGINPTALGGNQTNCTDSDGGIMPYIYGVVRAKGKSYPDFCWNNGTNITNSSVLNEYYCNYTSPAHILIYCVSGCRSGACLKDGNWTRNMTLSLE